MRPIVGGELRTAIAFLVVGRAGNPDMSPGPGGANVYWPHARAPQNILSPLAKK